MLTGFPGGASGKEPTGQRRRPSIPGSGRSPGGGNGNPLQYSCLENPMDRGVWQATVHRAAKSQPRLKGLSTHPEKLFLGEGKSPSLLLLLLLSRFSRVRLCATPQTAAHAPPSLGFSRQEYWSGLHFLLQCMKVKVKSLSRVRLLGTPWTAAYQAPPSMGFSRQEYWSRLPLLSPTINYNCVK